MITMKCKKHPRYMAKLAPRAYCRGCWFLYALTKGIGKRERELAKVEVVR